MTRGAYRHELRSSFFLPFLLITVESSVLGVIVKNAYEGVVDPGTLDYAVAIISASVPAANILSFVWVRLASGVSKTRFSLTVHVLMGLFVCVVGLSPSNSVGIWLLTCSALLARVCWAGFITVRQTAWRFNYSRTMRARISGKLGMIQVTLVGTLSIVLAWLLGSSRSVFGVEPGAVFGYVVPVCVVVGLIGAVSWSRIRIRHEPMLLRDERENTSSGEDKGAPSFNPVSMVHVLAQDALFAKYMGCQFLLGMGNLMILAPFVFVLRDSLGLEYLGGIIFTATIPMLMMPLCIPLWSRLLDRVHVVRFRVFHSWVFVGANVLLVLAVSSVIWLESVPEDAGSEWAIVVSVPVSMVLFALASVLRGAAFGGGMLAWNLGHLDFAKPHQVSQYMGVHVTLTGVRGLLAPFLGVVLYQQIEGVAPGRGGLLFVVCLVLNLAGAVGFWVLSRSMPGGGGGVEEERHRRHPVEAAAPSRAN